MLLEFWKIAVGLGIMLFHRHIADFMLQHERSLVLIFRERGVPLPAAPTTETARNIYFCIGAFIVLFELSRIFLAMAGRIPLV